MTKVEYLLIVRKQNKLTRKAISELTETPNSTIEKYENGTNALKPEAPYAIALAAYFGVSPEIWELDDITPLDIENHTLSIQAQAVRKYMLWSGLSFDELAKVTNLEANILRALVIDSIDAFLNENIPLSMQDVINSTNKLLCVRIAGFIKIKPTSFGVCKEYLLTHIKDATKLNNNNFLQRSLDVLNKFDSYEKNGLELTKENVKRALTEGVIIQDSQIKEILELVQSNEFYKDANVLELLRLLPDMPRELLGSCIAKAKEIIALSKSL